MSPLKNSSRLSQEQKKAVVVDMTAHQTSLEKCAAVVGVSERTIQRWAKDDSTFRQELQAAREKMVMSLKTEAIAIATNKELPAKDRTPMLIFLLKTMGGLRENAPIEQEQTGPEVIGFEVRVVNNRVRPDGT